MLNHHESAALNLKSDTLTSSPPEKESLNTEKSLYEVSLQKKINGKVHEICQEYTVPNVSQHMFWDDESPSTIFKCPEFSSGIERDNVKWFWRMSFSHGADNPWIYFYVNCTKNDVGIRAIITIYIIDSEGVEIFVSRRSDRYFGSHDKRVGNFFDKYKDIDKEKFFPKNSLTVRLKLKILLDDKTPFLPHLQIEREPKTNLPSHFKELYLSRENTGDLVIKVKEQLFRVHKEVIKIRYPRLLHMFASQLLQGKDNFEILGINSNVFGKLLEFMYLDEVTDVDDCIVPLWKAAHTYKLTALRSICEKIISEDFLSIKNADIVNKLAGKIGSSKLRFYIIFFLECNENN